MPLYGYARFSTTRQDLGLQQAALKAAGCEVTRPISAEVTALTGISAETVAGHALDPNAIGAFVAPSVIVLAHNAAFDRRFAERLHLWFSSKAWGCTMGEPPWREEGFEGIKLAYLAAHSEFFYDKHRALADCLATLELLRPPPARLRTHRPDPPPETGAVAELPALAGARAVRAQGHVQEPWLALERGRERAAAGVVDRPRRGGARG